MKFLKSVKNLTERTGKYIIEVKLVLCVCRFLLKKLSLICEIFPSVKILTIFVDFFVRFLKIDKLRFLLVVD